MQVKSTVSFSRCDVTVIIPCFNAGKTLGACLASVLSQSALPKEIIILDDCSDDSALLQKQIVIAQSKDQGRVRFSYHRFSTNKGPGYLRNFGWDLSTTQYIAFLDADDFWHPEKLFIQYSLMARDDSILLSCHAISKQLPRTIGACKTSPIFFECLLFHNRVLTSSVMVKTSYNERFIIDSKYCEDYSLWLKCSNSKCTLIYIKCVLCRQLNEYNDGNRLSQNLKEMHKGTQRELMNYFSPFGWPSLIVIIAVVFEYLKYFVRVFRLFIVKKTSISCQSSPD
jgi:glycosyltransferase involved in cell wall biosynthesis